VAVPVGRRLEMADDVAAVFAEVKTCLCHASPTALT
jgi:hypothetical protein